MKRPADVREDWDKEIYEPHPRAERNRQESGNLFWFVIAVIVIGALLIAKRGL